MSSLAQKFTPPPPKHRSDLARLRPFLLPLLFLSALAVLAASFLLSPRPAEASHVVWSGTLTVQTGHGALLGCSGATQCGSALSGNSLNIDIVQRDGGHLIFSLSRSITHAEKQDWALEVNQQTLRFADAIWWTAVGGDTIRWTPGLSWTAQQQVSLRVVDTDPPKLDEHVFPTLDQLPVDTAVEPVPPAQRGVEGDGRTDAFCYIGEGTGATEYIRYPDGRIVETTKASAFIRSRYAC